MEEPVLALQGELTDRCLEDIWSWNTTVPGAVGKCVHELFMEQAKSRPDVPAICAWDGELTYGELDALSTKLADHLIQLGVGPESRVPLCFEKSMWTVVAMLAVFKAGGAFVPLDPNYPAIRHESILKEIDTKVVLVSAQNATLWANLNRHVVTVSEASTSQLPVALHAPDPSVKPENAAYVIFTSGSTGVPKGVVLEHRAVATSCLGHGQAFGITKLSRVLQFASYTFDACIAEIITTLVYGGCICVPSNSDQCDNLAQAINAMDVNWALLTPSVARLLDPNLVPSIKILVLGGEQVSFADWNRWQGSSVQTLNAYGPTECAVCCNAYVGIQEFKSGIIGTSVTSVSWVVDPENHDRLAPLGSIGELLVEGPILARGYLNDIQKTEAAFIDDPAWLLEGYGGHAGRQGRLYKTGDLVRYNSDGNLIYLGRKDSQVKVRGQRVELGEVEHHVRECLPTANDVVAEIITPDDSHDKAILVAFVCVDKSHNMELRVATQAAKETSRFTAMVQSAEVNLEQHLPNHMMPSLYIPINRIPMTTSGKIDRKQLRELGSSFSAQQLAEMQGKCNGIKRQPEIEIEYKLQRVWAQVLNMPPNEIGLDDSLFRLGGDSISAMQVVSLCRTDGIILTTKDVMRGKDIRRLAKLVKFSQSSEVDAELLEREQAGLPFELSPIQQMYIQAFPGRDECFDQCFYLRLNKPVSTSTMTRALETVVQQHAMLRARIRQQSDGTWRQTVTNDVQGSLQWRHHRLVNDNTVGEVIADSRRALDFGKGPVLAADLFSINEAQTFFITVHHLFVDLVSWRIILQDIEQMVLTGSMPSLPTIPFQSWCQLQRTHAHRHLTPKSVLPFKIKPPMISYWGVEDHSGTWSDTVKHEFTLDAPTTASILGECNEGLRTEPVELFIAGLIQSFSQVFQDRDVPTVFSEGHGREPWDDNIDLSRTVGWFTTLSPVNCATTSTGKIKDTIRRTKDGRRSLSHKGWGYFASRFHNPEGIEAFKQQSPIEVLVNYQGLYQQLERQDTLFQRSDAPGDQDLDVSLQGGRFALFVVSIVVQNSKAIVSFMFNRKAKHQDRIAHWIQNYETTMQGIVAVMHNEERKYTLSDFPAVFRDYRDLDEFAQKTLPGLGVSNIEDVDNIYQCSPMQQAILLNRIEHPKNYWIRSSFKVVQAPGGLEISVPRIQRAWEAVVERHAILRTVFVLDLPGVAGPAQVVLRNRKVGIKHVEVKHRTTAANLFKEHVDVTDEQRHGLEHHLTIYELLDGTVLCILEISHAIVDGHSMTILCRDLSVAYSDCLQFEALPPYSDYITFLQQEDRSESLEYWKCYLSGVEPCLFPCSSTIADEVDNKDNKCDEHDPSEYSIVLHVDEYESSFELACSYQNSKISSIQAKRVADTVGHILLAIIGNYGGKLENLYMVGKRDLKQLWTWNEEVPHAIDQCLHDLFTEQVKALPDAPAICAWDGELTYGELDVLSSKLASHLVQLGVKPEDIVPLCFEKSMWTVVAMLAVLKAGCAFVPLDPEHPVSRHEDIFKQTNAKVLLTSAQNASLWANLNRRVVTVSKATTSQLPSVVATTKPSVEPGNAAYVIFTSGSTGVPKGVVLEHRAVATSCLGHGQAFGITKLSRVLQFASYTFDACIAEIITTLVYGGCVCVPSNSDRCDDLAKAINAMDVDWALLTPSTARLLDPNLVPSLKILLIGGEQVSLADWDRWQGSIQAIIVYGPTECAVCCNAYVGIQGFKSGTIGTSVASVSWVVDPENHDRLAPLGSIGELLVEGPILARGYLNDVDKTAAAFIDDPVWLLEGYEGHTGRQGRLYKTGDLVRYDNDGNLVCLGRKDSQVKVRGQRVELGEVEHHVRECLPEAKQLAVEVIVPEGEGSHTMLAAFMRLDGATRVQQVGSKAGGDDSTAQVVFLAGVEEELAQRLPRHMVPTVFFTLLHFPMTTSGKTDRKRLREIGASFTAQQLAEMRTSSQGPKRQPLTEAEQTMQQLWARVLGIEPDSIGLDDSFFRLGGDSIAAMKLVGEARQTGLQLSVADIFRHPKLAELASRETQQCSSTTVEEVPAFSLLGEDVDTAQVREEAAAMCGIDSSMVEDVYSCSPLQEGLISLTAKRAGDYIMQSVLELRAGVDEDALRAAWEHVVQSTAVLRTRIVQHNELGLLQVVVEEKVQWVESESLEKYLQEGKSASMELGDRLACYALVKEPYDGGKRWFVWTIHHTLYDGWSLPRILYAVKQVYSGVALERQPSFNAFIQYLSQQNQKDATSYWQSALVDCEATLFPPLPSSVKQPVADTMVEYQCPPFTRCTTDMTMSTLIRAAWALVASRYTSSDDVVFGTTVTGRNAPIAGIEVMVGPTIATVPLRVHLQNDQVVSTLLECLQQQATGMIAYEQTGLQHIAKMGPGPQHACGFQTLLIVQPADDVLGSDDTLGEWRGHSKLQDFTTYALMVQCTLAAEGMQITASFDARVMEGWVVEKMLRQFSCVMQQLAEATSDSKVADINTTTAEDREQLWAWNQDVPPAIDRCLHDLFTEQATARPDAPALFAWDGELTYGELDALSTKLAGHLNQLGVKPEDMVPLCFEKSMWTVVAMLAVLKAGGAFVPLDPDHPASRHEDIFRQTGAQFVLASAQHATLWTSLGRSVVIVSETSTSQLPVVTNAADPSVNPGNAAYAIFTSGSTGIPKGVVLEHKAVATSCLGHGQAFGITDHARVLQFASYTFDVCIAEIFTTLVYGGCICVPSDSDRRDNLAKAINTMSINCALLTPSVAQLLDPSIVPSLRILVLQGEQVNFTDWDKWPISVQTINGYGPTECCVFCTGYTSVQQGFQSGTIGTSIASVSWVVDPKNYQKLAPLGSIGELLVEGPILAREYLNDVKKTETAFINDPAWLLEGHGDHAGRRGRLYKTGDLVRYNSDGKLICLGRKDSQVKVRGQRFELGEVEHHVRECLLEAKQLAVEVVLPLGQKDHAMLAVFVQLDDNTRDVLLVNEDAKDDSTARVVFLARIEEELAERLPRHMVPTVFFALKQFPVTTSGKTDRKRLREIGASFTAQQLAEMRTSRQGHKRKPSTEVERIMQRLWGRVLGIEPDNIGLDDSFFRLGGDSITAMQISSSARAFHLSVSTGDILKRKTIALIACDILPSTSTLSRFVWRDPVNNAFDLTPIQHLYLALDPSGCSSFDQCFFLELRDRVQPRLLVTALTALVQRHSMLRARFQRPTGGRWRQYISEHDSSSLIVNHIHTRDTAEIVEALRQSRGSLDIERGPVLAAVLCDAGERQSLFVAIHHLVVDLVSWRVLLEELEDLLLGQTLPPALSTPFQAWQAAQDNYVAEYMAHEPSVVTKVELDPDQLSYWGVSPEDLLSGYAVSEGFILDSETTSALLGSCNDAFSTRPLELMVAALAYSFTAVFPDRKTPAIFNEVHGREVSEDSIDLTRTVGWFTSMYPVQVANRTGYSLLDTIRETKDCMRSFQDNGWSYLASQFASASAADTFASLFPIEILFNYQGLYQQLERKDSLFKNLPIPEGCEPALAASCPRFAIFDVSLVIEQGCAKITFIRDRRANHQDRIRQWMRQYTTTLIDMSALLSNRSAEWTLSDLSLSFSSYIDLDRFRHKTLPGLEVRPEDVEDVFPCSPMQEGILTSQGKDIDSYWICLIYEVMPNQENLISLDRLQQAWKRVVRRHSLLRTMLVDNVPGSTGTTNVVLKDPKPSISVFRSLEGAATVKMFRSRYNPAAQKQIGRLQHHLSICQLNNGKVYLCLDINHAIIDAHSRGILLHDLQKAYDTSLDIHSSSFRNFVAYTKQQSHEEAGRYWAEYLNGVEPCNFSSLRECGDAKDTSRTVEVPGINAIAILAFCKVWEITPATIIQTAWALVLSRYTNSATPCFGNLSLGRDLPIDNVNDIFGPLIAMLPCRYNIVVGAGYSKEVIEINMTFRAGCMDLAQATRLAGNFSQAIKAVTAEPHSRIYTLDILTYNESQKVWGWNADVPAAVERCVHDLFTDQVKALPDAPAICAWDGELTYGELDALSSRLAGHLVQLSIKPEEVVPLCFEKSMWTVVAMLAVLKAGGAFVPLDPDHPATRHEDIFRQTGAKVVIASAQHSARWTGMSHQVVTVSAGSLEQLSTLANTDSLPTNPKNAAYVIFTSGSTGIPKGVVLEHGAVVTSCLGHGQAFGITNLSRVLQFASYTFDACIAEIITTLVHGGCICVPSDSDRRHDLAKAIKAMDINWALLTPSVAQLLDPHIVPSLEILVLGGEQVSFAHWDRWLGSVQMINAYGPTECAVCCNTYVGKQGFKSGTIGTSVASVSWVVDPENHDRLAPLGSIGELLVEGPILARGYLNDAEKTVAAFIDDPAWLLEGYRGHGGRRGRLYKTGDLVRYNADGNLVCLGRKDSQVKVRGQRVELGEVEHHVRECLPEAKQLAVEVIVPSGEGDHAMLAAFVQLDDSQDTFLVNGSARTNPAAQVVFLPGTEAELAKRLPEHMVPTVFLGLIQIPITTSGKTDRKRLREIGASFTAQQLAEMRTCFQGLKRQPSTEVERTMQQLWEGVLGIKPDNIGLDDSFFHLGGDSIAAMKLVGEARKAGVQFSVADIFRYPRLVDLAGLQNNQCSDIVEEIPAVSLLGEDEDTMQVREEAAAMCSVNASIIEDMYPCSPLQEGLMSLTAKRAGDYIMQSVLSLRADVDEDALRAAWERVVQLTAALRTRIVQHTELGLLQVVVAEDIQWTESTLDLEEYLKEDKAVSMGLGDPLTRYALVKEAYGGKRWFVWTIHHALYDGWSVPQILQAVKQVYRGAVLQRQPGFNTFIKYLGQQDPEATTVYWQTVLADCEAALFPPLPSTVTQPVADTTINYQCPPLSQSATDITTSTLVRAAWAIVTSRYTSSDDVVFGTTVTGRNAPITGVEAIVGPTIATVPLRVCLQKDQTVFAFLECLQQQATDMIAYEQTGLQRIAKMGSGARHACGFQTLLVVQPADDVLDSDNSLGEWRGYSKLQEFTTYALMVQCTLAAEGVQITAIFDARVIERWVVEKMLRQFSFVMQQLAEADEEKKVAGIGTTTLEDRQQLWAWNQNVPPAVDRCIHDLFTEQVKALPDAPAICAWDGELTYGELDALSSKLAGHLIQLGIKREDMVPLCFEKSMWTVVAMLAVLKAGGVFVPLDPEHPRIRQRKILEQTRAKVVVVSSKQHLSLWADEAQNVVVVSRTSIQLLSDATQPTHATVYPMDAAYVIFTSGSTGKPKGVVIEHKALSASCLGHGKAFNMSSSTRALQFTSYTADISIAEIITTLVHGGCVCIPSQTDRLNDISLAIQKLQVNWAYLTPTVARLIDANAVPSLDVLLLGGEPVTLKECRRWKGKVELINTYGPTECCVLCSAFFGIENFESGLIGKSIASVSWVVDPENHDRLAPLGSVGELLVEGPILARGYLNDVDKTSAAFIDDPAWLLEGYRGHEGRQGRLYKTGDLVRYSSDGNLVCLGRKDGQVKVRGQRVELGEVEHHVRECLPKAKQLAVEVVLPSGERDHAMLAAFIRLDDETRNAPIMTKDAEDYSTAQIVFLEGVEEELAERLPRYMVPTVFLALLHFPTTTSGKTDRKRLREIGASFTAQQLAEMRTSTQGPKRQPSTEVERTMQRLWGRVLGIEPDSIGLDDSFFRLGGDSITAMQISSSAQVAEAMRQSRGSLDIERGPLLAAVLCDISGGQSLFVAIHHLVVDLVSWRVLLGELEDLLLGRTLPPASSTPFQAWHAAQAEHILEYVQPSVTAQVELDPSQLSSYWGVSPDDVLSGYAVSEGFVLDNKTTSALLGNCNDAFSTRPLELMVAALAYTFTTVFPDRKTPAIFNEIHGREVWDSSIDLTQTVGWFTSMCPVQVANRTGHSLLDAIRETKDCMRSFQDNGWPYFASQFARTSTADAFASLFPVEVVFNYQGLYQQLERKDSLFKNIPIPYNCEPALAAACPRFAMFDVSFVVEQGCAKVSFVSDRRARHQDRIRQWIQKYMATLVDMSALLPKRTTEWTLENFSWTFSSYTDLDRFRHKTLPGLEVRPEDVEDVFPCTPMQEGILTSQGKDPDAYWVCFVYEVIPNQETSISLARLQQAWKDVVPRHSLLRTLLVDNVPGSTGTTNVVLKDPQPSISVFSSEGTATIELFRSRYNPAAQRHIGRLQHYLSICQLNNGKVYLCLDINHAIIDAHSRGILMHDLQEAYDANLDPHSTSFRDFASYTKQKSQEEAGRYWAEYLDGVEPCSFPPLGDSGGANTISRTVEVPSIDSSAVHMFCKIWEVTPATIIQTAWALVLSRYTNSTTPCFGNLSSGRDLPIHNVNSIFGPLIAMLPCRVHLHKQLTVLEALKTVQENYASSLSYQMFPLASMHSFLGLGTSALFNTALSLQRIDDIGPCSASEITLKMKEGLDPTEYNIMISAGYSRDAIEISMNFRAGCIDPVQAIRLASSFSQAIKAITGEPNSRIYTLDILSYTEMQEIWARNADVPPTVERCVHELFAEQARARPDVPAICAWDGELTYGELDALSSKLSGHLVQLGVKSEDIVPLCFEKSMWTVVAMLAVLKAGGAFVSLDPDHPASRHKEIFRQTDAKVLLTSAQNASLWASLNRCVVTVSRASTSQLPPVIATAKPSVKPGNAAYIMFTSGSSGLPKGVVLEHRAVVTSCLGHGQAFGITDLSRVLQFTAYTFDVCIAEIITTLVHGGCICVPSDSERRDNLAKAITDMQVNWGYLTSSVARLLDPCLVPSLKVLVLGGEQVNSTDWGKWPSSIQTINGYGPTECCVFCTGYTSIQGFHSGNIGTSIASVSWVVDPENHDRLAPLGSIGELLVEGPILARGYLNDMEKTEAAFIDDPAWLLEGYGSYAGRQGRLYKTGDLVRYNANGDLVCLGRKDSQIKVRGQRVELGEIEHHVRECLPEAKQLAVEVIVPEGEGGHAMLAAFVQLDDNTRDVLLVNEDAREDSKVRVVFLAGIEEELAERLPGYMVPTVFLAPLHFPTTTSGKTDRKRLGEIGASFTAQQVAEMQTFCQGPKRQPSTEAEQTMQQLWVQVLRIEPDSIGLDDSFFRLGGDSIAAMKLVGEARRSGLQLSVADIFRHPKLAELAGPNISQFCSTAEEVPAFSLLSSHVKDMIFSATMPFGHSILMDKVDDVLPVSYIQEFYIANGIRAPREAFNYFFIDLGTALDVQVLKHSCCALLDHFSILRTHFLDFQGKLYQVIPRHQELPFSIFDVDGPLAEESMAIYIRDLDQTSRLGLPTSFTLVRAATGMNRLIIRLSHAQYDGVCLPVMLRTLATIYQQEPLHLTTGFHNFLAYVRDRHSLSVHYWRGLLAGSYITNITSKICPKARKDIALQKVKVERNICTPQLPAGLTMASLISSAWAVVLSHIIVKEDVVYGLVVAGRNSNLLGITELMGPCVNIIPVRVQAFSTKTSMELLQSVQDQYVSLSESDSMGLDDIIQHCTDWPAESMFDSIVQHQNIDEQPELVFAGKTTKLEWFDNPFAVPRQLSVLSHPRGDNLTITISGNTGMLTDQSAEKLLAMLCDTIMQLSHNLETHLAVCKLSLPACTWDDE
ncbi:hypothetical protein PTMSG1_02982 [Pyrenophora teres f. maculata]|nr:hypothetical protein PTMSG1_02982 [Pyrenophora teres f. maculata]